MGLLDVLNGMRNGPGGQPSQSNRGGMSPITMAILALLAYKGIKHLGAQQQPSNNPMTPGMPSGGGGLGGLLQGGLGGLLAGGAAGSILSGGLGSLLNQFQQQGQGQVRQLLGRQRAEPGHHGERYGEVDWERGYRRAVEAHRSTPRPVTLRPQPRTARRN